MSKITFHKCKICGCIFYHGAKVSYCAKCIPSFPGRGKAYYALNNIKTLEEKRALERERWRARMANPKFKEAERLRSLARARINRKYAKLGGEE